MCISACERGRGVRGGGFCLKTMPFKKSAMRAPQGLSERVKRVDFVARWSCWLLKTDNGGVVDIGVPDI